MGNTAPRECSLSLAVWEIGAFYEFTIMDRKEKLLWKKMIRTSALLLLLDEVVSSPFMTCESIYQLSSVATALGVVRSKCL